jgi:dephospho-CoA kinase
MNSIAPGLAGDWCMKIIGLTGGVGMGKSTAAGFLLQSGVHVVDTDEIARQLVQPGQPALEEIRKQFTPSMIAPDGTLDRHQLAHLVFSDTSALRRLESILHPRIREAWQSQVAGWRAEGCSVAAVVIPLLFETQAEKMFDQIICAACSPDSQHARLRSRGWSDFQIRQRMAAQLPVDQKMARSQFVVWTEGSLETHRRQIVEILSRG